MNQFQGTSFPDIVAAVCDLSGHSLPEMYGPRRPNRLAHARQLIMLLACERCPWLSLPRIGMYLNRDHTTVMHGRNAARRRIARDEGYREFYNAVVERLDGQCEAAE